MNTYIEKRPWGNFEKFCENKLCTVKILNVGPGKKLSLQYHNHRNEFWKIITGTAKIIIDDKTHEGKEGDEFFIPVETKHRIITDKSHARILEISYGNFDENDIVRLEDEYRRLD